MKLICSKLLRLLGIVISVSIISIHAPSYHLKYLRSKVGSNVYQIMKLNGQGGGTGFSIKTRLGKSVILTNKHVCGIEGNYINVVADNKTFKQKIIARNNRHDLCMIEGIPYKENELSLGSPATIGDTVAIVGHPHLTPLQVSKGIVNSDIVKEDLNFLYGLELPLVNEVQFTSAPSYPGNSGSPVVDFFGNVVGVLFAGSGPHINMIVPHKYIKEFLDRY